MQTIIDGLLTNYEIFGNKNKDAILILHGWGRSLKDWQNIAKILSVKNKVILIDLPGFGQSPNPPKTLDIYDYAQVINNFIEKLKLDNITLIGHSFGGKISTILASENSKIRKLVLVDASGVENKSLISKLKINLVKLIKPIMKLFPQNLQNKIFDFIAAPDYKNANPILRESLKKILSQNVSESAKKIKIPTLIIWGDKDKALEVKNAKKFRSLISNSYIRIVWNTGHDPFLEKQNKFLEILEEFV